MAGDAHKDVSVYCSVCEETWAWDELDGSDCPACNHTICSKNMQSGDDADESDDDEHQLEAWEKFYDAMGGPMFDPDAPVSRGDEGPPVVPDVRDKRDE